MKCPLDNKPLRTQNNIHSCTSCGGSFHTKEGLNPDFFATLGDRFRKRRSYSPKSCPSCKEEMIEVEHRKGGLHIDVCPSCQSVWFDYGEMEKIQSYLKRRLGRPQYYLNKKARSQENRVQALYQRYQNSPGKHDDPSMKEVLFQILSSLPIERNLRPIKTPVTVFILIALNLIGFYLSLDRGLEVFLNQWAYIPGKTPLFPNIINSMFLHGGFVHILGNMYFLWVMGDNVEDLMGSFNFLAIYFLAGILGFYASGLSGPQGVPHVGASGAVAGIMAAYLLLFPKAKFLLRFFIVIVIPISSLVYIGFWFAMNLFQYLFMKQTSISWSAHIVGFVVGLVATTIFKKSHKI